MRAVPSWQVLWQNWTASMVLVKLTHRWAHTLCGFQHFGPGHRRQRELASHDSARAGSGLARECTCRQGPTMTTCVQPGAAAVLRESQTIRLPTSEVRTDGRTQGRRSLNLEIVREYGALMKAGIEFPPVRVFFDGDVYWLTDGFHRLAATKELYRSEILAEVLYGTLSDALWDSCSANTTHGLRRNRRDIEVIITRALAHPNGLILSNNQIAKHLGIPEATLRRWRKELSSSDDEDDRIAVRGGATYRINTKRIGKHSTQLTSECRHKHQVKGELLEMKSEASPDARRVLNIFGNWLFGRGSVSDCLSAVERLLRELKGQTS